MNNISRHTIAQSQVANVTGWNAPNTLGSTGRNGSGTRLADAADDDGTLAR